MPLLDTGIKHLGRYGDSSRLFTVTMFPPPKGKLFTSHTDYRDEPKGPPRQMNDKIVLVFVELVRRLDKESMVFAVAGFRITAWTQRFRSDRTLFVALARCIPFSSRSKKSHLQPGSHFAAARPS
jgi:hypothetical protein